MEQLPLVQHQEPNWDVKINDAINRLNEMGGVTDNLQLQPFTDSGIVFLNNFQNKDNLSGYRFVKVPGGKLVELNIDTTFSGATDWSGGAWFKVPECIKPTNYTGYGPVGAGAFTYGLANDYLTFYLMKSAGYNEPWDNQKATYTMQTVYFHAD